ncbi:MAG TPA: aminoglycoside phosphotransferase family protein [Mycobacteriales bacterium]|nr:aminoglycoside phosphotransferase family protein [Mycobacteriales bacterium]
MTEPDPNDIADAFGFPPPVGPLHPLPHRGFKRSWRIHTGAGSRLVKNFWPYDDLPWRADLERAMDLEARAVRAGVDTPAPIRPAHPVFGTVACIEGHGLFRAFPFLEHRQLSDADDIAEWMGRTLARIHRLQPVTTAPEPNWWYGQAPPVTPENWRRWLEDGTRAGISWAGALERNFELVVEESRRVAATFRSASPYVLSHLDIEPQNVLMTEAGPKLIDWDATAADSAELQAAFVFVEFARRGRTEPDPAAVRASHEAYVAAGGQPLTPRPYLLDRVIGRHLATITTALGGYFEGGHSEEQIRARIEELPTVVADTRAAEDILRKSL